jgi:hypothetical protein
MTAKRLFHDCTGAGAAEFAMVLPLLLILLLGIIDAGRFMWEFNRAEKATQVGARVAIVTNSVPDGLKDEQYVGQTVNGVTLTQGDVIPAAALGEAQCTSTGCTCVASPCPNPLGALDPDTFNNVLLPRMQAIYPKIEADNVELSYSGSGLGFAGDPNGMQIVPIVTVKLTGLDFVPVTTFLLASIPMQHFRTSLTAEDVSGTQSN